MTSDSDWDSHSVDSCPSSLNDGAEAILMNTSLKIEAPRGGEEHDQSRCSTPESHKGCEGCPRHGQGTSVYSCGCYNYREMERLKLLKFLPPDREQVCLMCRLYDAILMSVISGIRI